MAGNSKEPRQSTVENALNNYDTHTHVRKARIQDAERIQALVNYWAKKDQMLFRSLSEIYEHLRDYWVWEEDGRLLGTSALHVDWKDLAEVRSVAVDADVQGRGVGTALVKQCLDEARELGIANIFALTYQPGFFKRLGFTECSKDELPRKIWNECIRCPKFPECDEIALMLHLDADAPVKGPAQ